MNRALVTVGALTVGAALLYAFVDTATSVNELLKKVTIDTRFDWDNSARKLLLVATINNPTTTEVEIRQPYIRMTVNGALAAQTPNTATFSRLAANSSTSITLPFTFDTQSVLQLGIGTLMDLLTGKLGTIEAVATTESAVRLKGVTLPLTSTKTKKLV